MDLGFKNLAANLIGLEVLDAAGCQERVLNVGVGGRDTGGKWSFTQWVHCEFIVSFEAICPVITHQVCGEFF